MSQNETATTYQVSPVGHIRRDGDRVWIQVGPAYRPALEALGGFSHVQVVWWFSRLDTPECRQVLQTDDAPYEAPPMGVFACRSPVRPNPLALSTARILNVDVEAGVVRLGSIDGYRDTPVLDLKPYIPVCDRVQDVTVADWASDWPPWMPPDGLPLETGEE